jgi:hypothetical protein
MAVQVNVAFGDQPCSWITRAVPPICAGGGAYRCRSQRSPIWPFCAACNQQGVATVQLVMGLETLCIR